MRLVLSAGIALLIIGFVVIAKTPFTGTGSVLIVTATIGIFGGFAEERAAKRRRSRGNATAQIDR